MIAVDVNVVAYLLIEGEHTAVAEGLVATDPEWAAPLLWRSEWRNVLAGYLCRGTMDRAAAEAAVRGAERILHGREYLPDGARVLELVERSDCSAYACEYVAVAETLGVRLAT
ncbi:MAG: type II toxin-antitoxin system VapC family toxin [Longimicrobiales bacterium]